jgi:hypothetical protein
MKKSKILSFYPGEDERKKPSHATIPLRKERSGRNEIRMQTTAWQRGERRSRGSVPDKRQIPGVLERKRRQL